MRRLAFLTLVVTVSLVAAKTLAGDHSPATDWMSEAKVGAFMHFLPGESNFSLVDRFDVPAVAKQLADSGVRYFVFTLGQNSGYMNSPNDVYESLGGFTPHSRCSRRDLPRELASALKPHGIRLMLYLPCQTPNRDLQAVRAFGLPVDPKDADRRINKDFATKWAKVIRHWSDHYGESVSGWWFDGGYRRVDFNSNIAAIYAAAAKHGNPKSIVTFNSGVDLVRSTDAEDYTAGELDEPFKYTCAGRWVSGSQWHALTYLGASWGQRSPRYSTAQWVRWVKEVTSKGGAVTLDLGPNDNPNAGPVGTFSAAEIKQLQEIVRAAKDR
ncbi:MAG: alpha-L-fucosidase [Thermoguttaceae bacterium]